MAYIPSPVELEEILAAPVLSDMTHRKAALGPTQGKQRCYDVEGGPSCPGGVSHTLAHPETWRGLQ